MLTEEEIRERTQYCSCVLMQLGWLHDNEWVEPSRYLEYLQHSSLQLGSDPFITTTIEEALAMHRADGGLDTLLAFYEGLVLAYCEVLETSREEVTQELSRDLLRRLASEVGVELKL